MKDNGATPIELQSVIDAHDNAFVVIDENYTIVAANKAYSDAYGVDPAEIVGRKCHQVSHHSDLPCHLNGEDCPHKQVFETGQPYQVLHIHFDQYEQAEHVRIKGSPIRGADGELYLGESVFPIAKAHELCCDEQRILGHSPAFMACIEEITNAAKSDAPILLNGESGAGKEMAAEFAHNKSARSGKAFVSIDCTAISEGMFESELFGCEQAVSEGGFGGHEGLIEDADGGTLFLNEVSEIPLNIQSRLLRVLESGKFRRLGGHEDLTADIRVICATHNNLRKMVEENTFRGDLYYRIAGISIAIPPLRERREDIPELAETLLQKVTNGDNIQCKITQDSLDVLSNYDYPGNIRELQNILQKAATLSTNGIITPDLLQLDEYANIYQNPLADRRSNSRNNDDYGKRSMSELESEHIRSLLSQFNGHRSKVAEILKISERTLYRKLKQYGLQDVGKKRDKGTDGSQQPAGGPDLY
ncbi:MAG: sigma 54-interacting transcriptional regulator [Gammaproteobacteria bacterium]|nr:sigma 54-interacting transcriptional regulator [Gammaproteobacteria bacterium]NNJ98403.1 sigma 54-interacting transcriptional regulator [Gammaproteobacteria bacterium]